MSDGRGHSSPGLPRLILHSRDVSRRNSGESSPEVRLWVYDGDSPAFRRAHSVPSGSPEGACLPHGSMGKEIRDRCRSGAGPFDARVRRALLPPPTKETTTMKYMLIMRSNDEAVEAYKDLDFNEVIAAMGAYNESLIKAGVLLAGEGLTDAEEGFVVDFDSTPPVVTDGPYAEAKELFNGFWIIGVSSKEEAV